MNAEEIYRSRLRGSTNNPNLRTGLPSNESNSGWNWSNIWQNRWPWEEPTTEPEESFFSTVGRWTGTAFAAPFITSKMEPEEKERYKAEKDDNWWKAHFGEESQFASEYRDLPFWGQMLAEAPVALLTGGLASGGIKALGSAVAKGGLKGGLARVGQGVLSTFGGDATAVFKGAQKAGGISGRVAQALAAPGMAGETVLKGIGGGIKSGGAQFASLFKKLTGIDFNAKDLAAAKNIASKSNMDETQQFATVKITKLIRETKAEVKSAGLEASQERAKRTAELFRIQEDPNLTPRQKQIQGKIATSGEYPSAKPTRVYESIKAELTSDEILSFEKLPYQTDFDVPAEDLAWTRLRAYDAIQKMLDPVAYGGMPQLNEIALIEKMAGKDLAKALMDKRSLGQKAYKLAMEITNIPRAFTTILDQSFIFRQGAILAARDPELALKSLGPSFKTFFSERAADAVDMVIQTDSEIGRMIRRGYTKFPALPGKVAVEMADRPEAFYSSMVETWPWLGNIIKSSNRAYTSGINLIRANFMSKQINLWKSMGMEDFEDAFNRIVKEQLEKGMSQYDAELMAKQTVKKLTKELKIITSIDYQELNNFTMTVTGRPSFGKYEAVSPLLSTFLFSPKLLLSRVMTPKYLFSPSKLVRQEAAKSLASFLAAGTSLLTLAQLRGWADIETDPRSADFAKIKMNNTRLDIWAGYQQYIRAMSSIFTGERKTQAGAVIEANRWDTATRFLESKYSPFIGLIRDVMKGETFLGEDMTVEGGFIGKQMYERLTPFVIQDLVDAFVQSGVEAGMPASLAYFGVGVQTYPEPTDEQYFNAERTMAYANIEDVVWSKNPEGVDIAKKYNEMKKEDAMKAKRYLAQYPQVIRALKEIENLKERWLIQNKRRT